MSSSASRNRSPLASSPKTTAQTELPGSGELRSAKSSQTADSTAEIEASATRDATAPASAGVRLPRIVWTPSWKSFPLDHSRATPTASPASWV